MLGSGLRRISHVIKSVSVGQGSSVRHATSAAAVKIDHEFLELQKAENPVKFHYSWLRDHCKCDKCVHPITGQKLNDTRAFDRHIKPKDAQIVDQQLHVNWPDGHNSVFDAQALVDKLLRREDKPQEQFIWDAAAIKAENIEKVDFHDYLNNEDALKQVMRNIFKYGFGWIKNAPCTEEIAEIGIERLGPINVSHEGRLEILGRGIKHNDISYSNAYLPMHTDLPYMLDPPGLTYLHCLERDCEGGETLIVDGYKIAEDLKEEDPAGFESLCNGMRRFEHTPPGIHFTNKNPLIKTDPLTGEIKMFRYGTIYMAELQIPQKYAEVYYRALTRFDEMIHDPKYVLPATLEEGDQMFIENWRMIHGRTGVSGKRTLAVSSMKMDDLKSRARVLNVL